MSDRRAAGWFGRSRLAASGIRATVSRSTVLSKKSGNLAPDRPIRETARLFRPAPTTEARREMDTRIAPGISRLDVVSTESAPRVTPPSGVPFKDMVSRGAGALLRGAEAAITSLPGAPIVAAAVRPGAGSSSASIRPLAAGGTGYTPASPG